MQTNPPPNSTSERRKFLKQCFMGGCGIGLGIHTISDLLSGGDSRLRVGFCNDSPERLWKWSREARWYETSKGPSKNMLHCLLCPHECVLSENDRGFCRVRVVKESKLYTLVCGNPCAIARDPIEKKPLFHFLPGTDILSIATAGCNLRCHNCQNWEISQSKPEKTDNSDLFPEMLVKLTLDLRSPSIAYTYSEPIIFYEYVMDSAIKARENQIKNVLVTAGYILEPPLREICRYVDGANVDLKGFSERFYKKVSGASLKPVLRAIEIMHEEGVWIELTRLIVPTLSDDLDDIRAMCRWIMTAVGSDVPLHFSRFHPAHKLLFLPLTPHETLLKARDIAWEEGLHFVYIGNLPGIEGGEDTICPTCKIPVIQREGFRILNNVVRNGRCPSGHPIPGVWQ